LLNHEPSALRERPKVAKAAKSAVPTRAAVTDAARYIKTLRDSGQLTSTGEQQSAGGVTHQSERDEQGRQVLRRKRSSIS
jgi:hypothetical protein